MRRKLIIDTDPGVDDMVAILAALHCAELDVLAITTVGGNVGLDVTTRNALRILARVGRLDVPVHTGLSGAHTAEEVHGEDGLAGCPWPVDGAARPGAVELLAHHLADETVTIACLGPLSNLAAALQQTASRAARVVLMGGGFGTHSFPAANGVVHSRGNITTEAEFNIYSDVAAAQQVFTSRLSITLVPLDVSQQTLVTATRLRQMEAQGELGREVARIVDVHGAFSRDRWGHHAGPLHDPNVIARIAAPDLYQGVRGQVSVTDAGRTDLEAGPGPHEVLLRVDADGYLDWVLTQLPEAYSN